MASYFYCPGVANVSATTVECVTGIQTYTPPEFEWLTRDNFNALFGVIATYWALIFVYRQLVKLIEQ